MGWKTSLVKGQVVNKHFQLYQSYSLCCNYSILPLKHKGRLENT